MNKLFLVGSALLSVALNSPLSWGVTLDEERVIPLTIAQDGLTRLSVREDKIQDLFVYPTEASNNIQLHTSGHVFITPEGLSGPLSVTLITASGKTQDLNLKSVKKKASPIYLEAKKPVPPPLSLTEAKKSPDEILSDFVFKGTSEGFQESPSVASRSVAGVTYRATRSWKNESYRVTLFEGGSYEDVKGDLPLSEAKREGDVLLAASLSKERASFFVLTS